MPPRPWLWLVLTERAEGVIAAWKMRRMPGWPRGFYASVVDRGPRVVAVATLARTRETLLLRLMGSGAARDAALEDLAALPEDEWERVMVEPLLRLLRRDLTHQGATIPIKEEEAMMNFREAIAEGKRLMAEDRQRWLEEGQKIGEEIGEKRGEELGEERGEKRALQKTLALLMRQFDRRLSRPLTAAERAVLTKRFEASGPDRLGDVVLDLTEPALAAWLADPDAQ